ncbi:hypothetical protein [Rhodococcus sp. Q]|uniref:hypothetical protein n=1 Tax=Rhodococcus sp. Q TaxID=2502252 RepID=UPI0010F4C439|nr:hypothetical protein [Rhodococcus sp. Q]
MQDYVTPEDVDTLLTEAMAFTAESAANYVVSTTFPSTDHDDARITVGRQVHTCEEEGETRVVLIDGQGFDLDTAEKIAAAILAQVEVLRSTAR